MTSNFLIISRSFIFEFVDNFSVTNLFGNLCDRIDFLLPEPFEKEQLKLAGKMYRSKQVTESNSICTLQNLNEIDEPSIYLINGKSVVHGDNSFDSIIGKLNLMYSARQSYSIEGFVWKSKGESVLVKCGAINSGSEAVNILIQVENDFILEKVFPDLLNGSSSSVKLVEVNESSNEYLDIIIKSIKLTL